MASGPSNVKAEHEMKYWRSRFVQEKQLNNTHYRHFYTDHFGLDYLFYSNKRILDVGCGPRGSLEWANTTLARIGLDPLVENYREIGIINHQMIYVGAPAEQIPFASGYFDVVFAFNSLDHVDNLEKAIAEISRVVKPGGLFLLLTELNHEPTECEPTVFSWDIVEKFDSHFQLLKELHYEKSSGGMYESIFADVRYDHSNSSTRYGILSAKFQKI
jgi:ubiquinone/menaquinone biosynthesis C-methylase UbiE